MYGCYACNPALEVIPEVVVRRMKRSIILACVLVLAVSVGLVLAGPVRAAFPGHNGPIAFGSYVPSGYQILAVNPDGSGLRQVTPGTARCYEPNISPDGNTIVFVQSTTSGVEICATTTTGADPQVLASGVVDDPSFSSKGRRLVFVRNDQVWVMSADGSQQRRLTRFGGHTRASSPFYSPNGKTIVFVAEVNIGRPSPKNRCAILAMNADGSHLRRLAYTSQPNRTWIPPTSGVSFSPSGRTIIYGAQKYYKTGEVIRKMNADGTNQRNLRGSYGRGWPCFSPDGLQIVCLNRQGQLWVARANGTHWRQLITLSTFATEPYWGPQAR